MLFGKGSDEYEEVIAFDNSNEYGIVLFYLVDEKDKIKYDVSKLQRSDETQKTLYTQIIGKNHSYIGIFIDDTELLQKASSIKIIFADDLDEEIYAVQQTVIQSKVQIIRYESNKQRKIKNIYVKNDNNQNVYEIK